MKPTLILALAALSILGIVAYATTAAQTRPSTESYAVDPVHTTVMFKIKHLGVSYFYGRINAPQGSFQFHPDNPEASAFDLNIKTANVDTKNANRDRHLKSPDFFNAKEFPTISFKSKKVEKAGDNKYRVTGDFSLHGVTREITIDVEHVGSANDPWGGYRCGFDTSFTIKRSDFGMNFMLNALGDEVTLWIGIEGTRR